MASVRERLDSTATHCLIAEAATYLLVTELIFAELYLGKEESRIVNYGGRMLRIEGKREPAPHLEIEVVQ